MTMANTVLVFLWGGITAYAVFAGADFGAGFWDLVAGDAQRGAEQRARIATSIGPVWEANHVWLIFVLVVLWTGFPSVFAAVASTLYIPFTIAAFGVILRGTGFAFRKEVTSVRIQRIFGACFAASSVITPFAFGAIGGGIASGRVPPGIDAGDVITSWINPTSVLGGVIAVCVCAYVAAVLLCADCKRDGQDELVEVFRRRALVMAVVIAIVGVAGAPILAIDSPQLFHGLIGRGLPVITVSGLFGLASIVLLWKRRLVAVRATAAVAVIAVVWSWGVAQYPVMLVPSYGVAQAAAPDAVLIALIIGLSIGIALVIPALLALFHLSQSPAATRHGGAAQPAELQDAVPDRSR